MQLSKAHHILRKRVDLNLCSLHTCNMWAYTKIHLFIYSFSVTKGEKNRFSQNTDSPKTDQYIQRRALFTFLKAFFRMILLLHSTFVLFLV